MKWIIMIFVVLIVPQIASAGNFIEKDRGVEETWKKFNQAADEKTKEIKQIVFGPITKILGILGVAYGVISTIISASPRPLITYGGIGLLISIVPYFVDTVFGAVITMDSEILKTLDNSPRLLFWRVDEAMIVFVPFMLGILFSSLMLLAMGFVLKYLYGRLRRHYSDINFQALVYWILGYGYKRLPPSYIRQLRR